MKSYIILFLIMMFGVPGLWAVNYDIMDEEEANYLRKAAPQKRSTYVSKEDTLYEERDCKKGYVYIYRPGRVIHCYPWEQAEMIRFEMKWEEKDKQEAERMQQMYAQEFQAEEKERAASRERMKQFNDECLKTLMGSLQKVVGALGAAK
jgi:hypothetical protein